MKSLDQSHRVLLENLATFHRAQRCLDDADSYLWELLQNVAVSISTDFQGKLPRFNRYNERGHRYLQTRDFENWRGLGKHFVTVGIEQFDVSGLVSPGEGTACRAYVYSEFLQDSTRAARFPDDEGLLRKIKPPAGFASAPEDMPGYIFLMNIGVVSVEDFMDSKRLLAFLKEPLRTLGEWLISISPTIKVTSKS